jgi:hypothetical protein
MPIEEALAEEPKMCLLCAADLDDRKLAQHAHVLRLLALVEHPDALPANAALRLAREILALTQAEPTDRRCDPVLPRNRFEEAPLRGNGHDSRC